jgi:ATP-dependent Lhr-like helicase
MGRWSALQALPNHRELDCMQDIPVRGTEEVRQVRLAAICQSLLRRYGVVFRAVLQRETLLPPWRELLRYYRRMEDRGEVRGGRFVDGFSGEQFALPEAIGLLRHCRAASADRQLVLIGAADPLNLGGIVVPGPKTPARSGNRILLEDGLPVARLLAGKLETLPGTSERARRLAEKLGTWQSADKICSRVGLSPP